jgi:hypothetical protein
MVVGGPTKSSGPLAACSDLPLPTGPAEQLRPDLIEREVRHEERERARSAPAVRIRCKSPLATFVKSILGDCYTLTIVPVDHPKKAADSRPFKYEPFLTDQQKRFSSELMTDESLRRRTHLSGHLERIV